MSFHLGQSGQRAAFDGHVTHGHATFHGQITDRFTTVLNHIACTSCSTRFTDNGQCNVLAVTPGRSLPVISTFMSLISLNQSLCRKNMFNL